VKYCLRTVTWRFHETSEALPELTGRASVVIRAPQDLYNAFRSLFDDQVRERFVVFWLDSTNKVMGWEIITEGTLNSSLVHPREVFRGAIVSTAAAVIVAHNHPSGNSEPSREDTETTKQLVESGKILGIPVHDHLIFTHQGYTSLGERGLI
jgi:DNA repair protein RadC